MKIIIIRLGLSKFLKKSLTSVTNVIMAEKKWLIEITEYNGEERALN